MDKSAEVSEAVGAACIVGAGEETGDKFRFASTAVQGYTTQGYKLLIFPVSVIPVLLFGGSIATDVLPCYRLVCRGLLRTSRN